MKIYVALCVAVTAVTGQTCSPGQYYNDGTGTLLQKLGYGVPIIELFGSKASDSRIIGLDSTF